MSFAKSVPFENGLGMEENMKRKHLKKAGAFLTASAMVLTLFSPFSANIEVHAQEKQFPTKAQFVTVDELKTVTIADSCKESFGAVIGIWVQSMIFDLITIIIKGSVSVMCYMRAMQLYVMAAFSPLPFALLGFDETKNYGVSFCKNCLLYTSDAADE